MAQTKYALAIVHREGLIRGALAASFAQVRPHAPVLQFPTLRDLYGHAQAGVVALVLVDETFIHDDRTDVFEVRRHLGAEVKLMLFAGRLSRLRVIGALVDGANGYLSQEMDGAQIAAAVEQVWSGGTFVPRLPEPVPAMPLRPADAPPSDARLTTRQRQVMALMRLGKSNKEIARDLSISEATVKVHIAAIFQVLHVRNRLSAIMHA